MEQSEPPAPVPQAAGGQHKMSSVGSRSVSDICSSDNGSDQRISSAIIDMGKEQHKNWPMRCASTARRKRRGTRRSGSNQFSSPSWGLCVVGTMTCALTLRALDRSLPALGLLPAVDAYELYDWDPNNLSPDFQQDSVEVDNYIVIADDDISEDAVEYNDDYVSADATYSNHNVAGVADYVGDGPGAYRSDGGGAVDDRSPPTPRPTRKPTTHRPTRRPRPPPTPKPTPKPTFAPTRSPTRDPTSVPTQAPSPDPTPDPTKAPVVQTTSPTDSPTSNPSASPTSLPTISPTSLPTIMPTSLPTSTPTIGPTVTASLSPSVTASSVPSFVPTQAPTPAPTVSTQPSATPTVPIPYTFTIQMTPFEVTLTSMDGELDGDQLQIFNLFSDRQIEQTWLSRKLNSLSEEDAQGLTNDFVDIAFETVVTSQLLMTPSPTQEPTLEANNLEESYRTTDDTPVPTSSPTIESPSKSKKKQKSASTAGRKRRRRRRRAAASTTRQEDRQQKRQYRQRQRRKLPKEQKENDIDHTSISTSVQRTLSVQQTKTAYITLRGEYLLKAQPEIVPTMNELDTAVQITYGTASSDLVTVLKDYDVQAFDELHTVEFLHFFYPSTVGGVASATSGQNEARSDEKKLSGGAIFGIFVASTVAAVLLGFGAVRLRRKQQSKAHTSKAASAKIKRLCSTYTDKMKFRINKSKSKSRQGKSPTASELGADNFLEDQYDEAIFQYEMDSYISSLGLGGISGSFDMAEPGYESGKRGSGGNDGKRKVRFQEDVSDGAYLPTPVANNRSIQSRPSHDASTGTNLDGVVYLCEKEEQKQTTSGEGVEGIFSTD